MPPSNLGGLAVRIVGPADAKRTCVLLHGYGAPGDDLVSLADYYKQLPVRFVFPAAPIDLSAAMGPMWGAARAWWNLDLDRLEADLRVGRAPDGLAPARAAVTALLDAVQTEFGVADDALVLGGFSQGAMLSLDVALHRGKPLAGLALMSGTLLAASEWRPRFAKLAGVRAVISHGRADQLLPFALAEQLRDELVAAGVQVSWVPFSGGHEIPRSVLDAVGALLKPSA